MYDRKRKVFFYKCTFLSVGHVSASFVSYKSFELVATTGTVFIVVDSLFNILCPVVAK